MDSDAPAVTIALIGKVIAFLLLANTMFIYPADHVLGADQVIITASRVLLWNSTRIDGVEPASTHFSQ